MCKLGPGCQHRAFTGVKAKEMDLSIAGAKLTIWRKEQAGVEEPARLIALSNGARMQPDPLCSGRCTQLPNKRTVNGLCVRSDRLKIKGTHVPQLWQHEQLSVGGRPRNQIEHSSGARIR